MFRELAKEMTNGEIRTCMAILVEDSVGLEICRDTVQNAVDVTFRVIGEDPDKLYELSLLSDSVDLRTEGIPLRIDGNICIFNTWWLKDTASIGREISL